VWWDGLSESEQVDVNSKVILLQRFGPALRRPHSGAIATSRHPNMKELVIQHRGRPYRVLYAFDPRRNAILLIGGDKTGKDRRTAGTRPLFPSPTSCSTNTLRH
jgi:hypothetical protein